MSDGAGVPGQFRDLPQPEPQPPVRQHLTQPVDVACRVRPVPARGTARRPDETDVVVVMQRTNAHPGQLGDTPYGPVLLHTPEGVTLTPREGQGCRHAVAATPTPMPMNNQPVVSSQR